MADPANRRRESGLSRSLLTRIPFVQSTNRPSVSFSPPAIPATAVYSALETRASQALQALIARQPISEVALCMLLDWLDKVRIGLWLGDMMRNKDFVAVERHFHISQRLGQKDRCAFIFTASHPENGFNFAGVFTPLFHIHPSCFGLRINGLYIVNISDDFLFMHRLGFPAFTDRYFHPSGKIGGIIRPGRQSVRLPLIRWSTTLAHFALFQPCIPDELFNTPHANISYFATDYVSRNLLQQHKGHLFGETGLQLFETPSSEIVVPPTGMRSYEQLFLQSKWMVMVLQAQLWLADNLPSMHLYSAEARKFWHAATSKAKQGNRAFIQKLEKELRPGYNSTE